jgi:hypothetical protein
MKRLVLLGLLMLCCQTALAQPSEQSLDSLKFLVGKWTGEGTNESTAGSGFFTFEPDLQNKVLVRKNHAEYPAANGRPAAIHDDVLIVFADTAAKQIRGFYTDSEGNTINYIVSVSSDGGRVVFLSDPKDAGTRYRLTYRVTQPGRMTLTFESAPPDTPDAFKQFIEGRVQRVPAR